MGFLDRIRNSGAPTTTAEADRIALRQLEDRGADLTQSRHIVHVLYFAHETDARAAAGAVEHTGYAASVEPPRETGSEWTVRAEASRVTTPTTVEAFRASFEQIATEFRGEYDGWEAAAKP